MNQRTAELDLPLAFTASPRGIDLHAALALVDDDLDLLIEIAALFLETAPPYLAQIRRALAEGKSRELETAAHALKGAIGNFGAQTAHEAAFFLERCGRNGDLPQAAHALPALEAALKAMTADLEAILAENGRPAVS